MNELPDFAGDFNSLIESYQVHPESGYQQISFATKQLYDTCIKRISADHGHIRVSDVEGRDTFKGWHKTWSASGAVSMAWSRMKVVQALISFGALVLKDRDCERLRTALYGAIPRKPKADREGMSEEQVVALRAKANAMGLASIALVQAFQRDTPLRQKEILGEWRPRDNARPSEIVDGDFDWFDGLLWREIDDLGRVRHRGARSANIETDLRTAPMVLEELRLQYPGSVTFDPSGLPHFDRSALPASGAVAVSEYTGLPWKAPEFRRRWRAVADALGLSRTLHNSDNNSPRDLVSSRLMQFQAENHRFRSALERIQARDPESELAHIAAHALAGSPDFTV